VLRGEDSHLDNEQLRIVDTLCEEILRESPGGPWLDDELWTAALEKPCRGNRELIAKVISYARTQRDSIAGASSFSLRFGYVPELQTIGEFTVLEHLGEGGMGTVYKVAFQGERFARPRALKLIKPPPNGVEPEAFLRRFWAEEQCLAKLVHPNIIDIISDGTHEGQAYFTMPFIEGAHIHRYCTPDVPLKRRLSLFQDVCRAVHFAHANGVLHRDLKPENILVSNTGHVTVLDFGLATSIDGAINSLMGGTPLYLAPELLDGEEPTVQSDIYSLGMLFERLLFKCPGYGPDGTTETASALRAQINKARNVVASERQVSVEELREKLERISSLIAEAPKPVSAPRILPFSQRSWIAGGMFAIAAVLIVPAIKLNIGKSSSGNPTQAAQVHEPVQSFGKASDVKSQSPKGKSGQSEIWKPQDAAAKADPPQTQSTTVSNSPQKTSVGTYCAEHVKIVDCERLARVITLKGPYSPFQMESSDGARRLVVDHFARKNAFEDSTWFQAVYMLDARNMRVLDSIEDPVNSPTGAGAVASDSLNYVIVGCSLLHFDVAKERFEKGPSPKVCADWRSSFMALTERGEIIDGSGACSVDRHVIIYAIAGGKCKKQDDYTFPWEPSASELYNNRTERYLLISDGTFHNFPETISLGDEKFSEYQAVTVSKDGKLMEGQRGWKKFVAEIPSGKIVKGPY
jgi:serine/threonine protein kinase